MQNPTNYNYTVPRSSTSNMSGNFTGMGYTIPKRKLDQEEPAYAQYGYQGYGQQSVDINDLYSSGSTYRMGYQQQQQNMANQTTAYNHLMRGSTTNNYNNLYYGEKPKIYTPATTTYKESFAEIHDPTLPKELTQMFQPLYCKLCKMQLSSSVMAKLHYKGQKHDKQVRKFLIEYSERTGEPLHKRAKITPKKTETTDDQDPKYFHCEVCDLPLTGRLHAESHYMGKNHQRVLAGKKNPSGKGYYDATGKWVRTELNRFKEPVRDTFGLDFIAPGLTETALKAPVSLRCDICQVSVTSVLQMEAHNNGQKHKKKLKALSIDTTDTTDLNMVSDINDVAMPKDNILASVLKSPENPKDLSVFRTPTGQYYCKPCNLTMNSETQFKQHLTSKNHVKKSSSCKEAAN